MKTFVIENNEKERIKFLYESKGIILNEDSIWGSLARVARKLAGQSEDDIAKVLKTTEVAITKSLDDIILSAVKAKNIAAADDIQVKLMHYFNPSGAQEGVTAAQQQVKNFLNGYAKSKGKLNWKTIRDEISGSTPQPKPQSQANPNPDYVQVRQNPVGAIFGNKLSGNRISNRSFETTTNWYKDIDSSKITNWGGSIDNYNKIIAKAIKTGDYQYVSSGGFEKFGIIDFRKFLKNNIAKINEVVPETGRWSVNFK
jgi:hypothetical protein